MLKILYILMLINKLMIEIQDLELVIMAEFLSTKIFLLKDIHQIGLKKVLLLVNLKI